MRKYLPLLLLLSLHSTDIFCQATFADSTSQLENGTLRSGAPMGVVDMNNDGLDDIICLDNRNLLYIHYRLPDTAAFNSRFIADLGGAKWSLCVADADGNGFNDIFTGGAYNNLYLLRADNSGSNYATTIITNPSIFLQGSNFVDIDLDNDLDVFACHDDGLSVPFANDGAGNLTADFSLITAASTIPSDNSGNYGSVWTDYDNDGDLDLYISKCRNGVEDPTDGRRLNLLFRNDGNGNYSDVAAQANLQPFGQSWASDFGDIDNDGDLDCFVINHDRNNTLHRNNGDGTFTDITLASNLNSALNNAGAGIQVKFADFNNDGFVDLLYTSLGTSHALLINNGNSTFTRATAPFPGAPTRIHSAAVGDLNNDGFLDVYAGFGFSYNQVSNESDRLFINTGNDNHFFKARLKGNAPNTNGIGARLELYGSWGKQIREIRSGESYGVMNSYTAHFGLGSATTIDSLLIRWPSGNIDRLIGPPADTMLYIEEGSFCIPNAGFQASSPGLTVIFQGGGDAGVTDWQWDFGDGATGSGQEVTHTYADEGAYTVCLTTDGSCGQAEYCRVVNIVCFSPLADFTFATDGLDIYFEDNSPGAPTEWYWTFGDGQSSTEQNPHHGFDTPGLYFVCLTATNECGNSSSCDFVQANCGVVNTYFNYDADGLSVQFTDFSSAGTNQWRWDFGDGATSTEQNPLHDFPMTGSYDVCLNVVSVCGQGQYCNTVHVSCPAPQAQFTTSANELSLTFQDTSIQEPTTWSWDFGDDSTSTEEIPVHTYALPGSYTVCLQVSSPCGQDSACQDITVTCSPPQAGFSYTANELQYTFTDTSTNQPTSWLWIVEGQDSLQGPILEYAFDSAGTYEICLQAGSICGMTETCQVVQASCVPLLAGFSYQADGLSLSFADTSGITAASWAWDFGDGATSQLQNPVHSYNLPGDYEACLTVANSCGDSSTTCRQLSLSCPAPEVGFDYQANMLSLFLNDTSSGAPTQWLWSFGDGNSSAQENPQHTYAAPGSYEVCLTAISACGSTQACTTVAIECAEPAAGFMVIRDGLSITVTDTSQNMPTQWSWTFGDGGSSNIQNPQHTYAAPGTYSLCLLAGSVCGSSQACRQVTVTCNPPQAAFTFQADELALSFNGQSDHTPSGWAWDFGDGASSMEANPQHTYAQPGAYQVCLQVSSPCGSNEACQEIVVSCAAPQPDFSFQADGLSLSFTGQAANTPDSWLWTFGDGASSTLPNPQHEYASPGSYQVCLQAGSICGQNTTCQAVEISCGAPQSAFSFITDALTVSFTDNSLPAASQWGWTFGDGATSTQANPQHTYPAPGAYTACLEVSTICGSTRSCQTFSVSCAPPEAGFTYTSNQLAVAFADQSTNNPTEWLWDFGDGNTASTANPQHTYELPGAYQVCLTAQSVCGMTQSCRNLTVNCFAPQANYTFSADELTLSFTDISTNNPSTWMWAFGDGNTSTEQNPTHTFEVPGAYLVCLSVSSPCGNTQRCELVAASCTPPQAGFDYSADGLVFTFRDTSSAGAVAWLWNFGDGGASTQANPQHLYSAPGAYNVCLTVSNICGNTRACTTVMVSCLPPEADFSVTQQGLTAGFSDNSTNAPEEWFWNFGDGNTSALPEPVHTFEAPGLYEVCLIVSNACGRDTLCQEVETMTTGLDEPGQQALNVSVYPNPSSQVAHLLVSAPEQGTYRWELYNSIGQQMSAGEGRAEMAEPVDMATLESGLYWMVVRMEKWRGVVKVVRE
ncbi:MAG: PKD domain-containing protein [Phaeodactylibacter sp.]|nr:PKD domain-containing protein [Phaeodactylibacter sp.]